MSISPRERFRWDLEGYLLVPDVLSQDELDRLNAGIDRHVETARDDGKVVYSDSLDGTRPRQILAGMLQWEHPWCDPFRDLLVDARMVPYLNEILGPGWRLDQHPFVIVTDQGAEGAVMHGTTRVDISNGFFHDYSEGHMRAGMIVVEYVLTDQRTGDGGFACIPGSHKANVRCPAEIVNWDTDQDLVFQPDAKAGDVIIFNEATLHGTLPWRAPHQRRALLQRYSPKYMSAGGGLASYVLPDWVEELSPEARWIMRPPTIVVDGMLSDEGVLVPSPGRRG